MPPPPGLILGVGNCLMADDGVGVHAARALQADPPPRTVVVDAGTDFLSALPYLEQCARALVIDAMDTDGPPGRLYYCRAEDVAGQPSPRSLHELGLLAALELLGARRPPVEVLGIQPARLGYGLELSPAVAAALPAVLAAARRWASAGW